MWIAAFVVSMVVVALVAYFFGWRARDVRASREYAAGAYVMCGAMLGVRKCIDEHRIADAREFLTHFAVQQFELWRMSGGTEPVGDGPTDANVRGARKELELAAAESNAEVEKLIASGVLDGRIQR